MDGSQAYEIKKNG